ncbi:MAG: hypothetical protein ABJC89_16330, partial [Acidobacteriota bacterium]
MIADWPVQLSLELRAPIAPILTAVRRLEAKGHREELILRPIGLLGIALSPDQVRHLHRHDGDAIHAAAMCPQWLI